MQAGRIYVDHGLTGTSRERPGLKQALAACRTGDPLVDTKLDRRARSTPDARVIAELTQRRVKRLDALAGRGLPERRSLLDQQHQLTGLRVNPRLRAAHAHSRPGRRP